LPLSDCYYDCSRNRGLVISASLSAFRSESGLYHLRS
jgi:hypothetical protein